MSDYDLVVLARVLSVQLDDLTKGTYEESLRMAQTTGKESQLRLKSSVHAISAVNLTQGSFFSEAVRAIRWQRGEVYATSFPLAGYSGGQPGKRPVHRCPSRLSHAPAELFQACA